MTFQQSVKIKRADIIEPELSYQVMGVLFDVYNALGPGYSESYYQKAIALGLQDKKIAFRKEVQLPVKFHGHFLGRQRCDFLIEGRLLPEIKKGSEFSRHNIEQVYNYLKASGLKLAILVNFGPKGVLFKRIVNEHSYIRKNS